MKVSIPGIGDPSAPQQRAGALARVHDQPFLSIEQAKRSAEERQRVSNATRAAEAEIAERLRAAK